MAALGITLYLVGLLTVLLRIPGLRRVFVMSGMLSMAWDLFTFVMPRLAPGTVGDGD